MTFRYYIYLQQIKQSSENMFYCYFLSFLFSFILIMHLLHSYVPTNRNYSALSGRARDFEEK